MFEWIEVPDEPSTVSVDIDTSLLIDGTSIRVTLILFLPLLTIFNLNLDKKRTMISKRGLTPLGKEKTGIEEICNLHVPAIRKAAY